MVWSEEDLQSELGAEGLARPDGWIAKVWPNGRAYSSTLAGRGESNWSKIGVVE
jgi:hypothetical protein